GIGHQVNDFRASCADDISIQSPFITERRLAERNGVESQFLGLRGNEFVPKSKIAGLQSLRYLLFCAGSLWIVVKNFDSDSLGAIWVAVRFFKICHIGRYIARVIFKICVHVIILPARLPQNLLPAGGGFHKKNWLAKLVGAYVQFFTGCE